MGNENLPPETVKTEIPVNTSISKKDFDQLPEAEPAHYEGTNNRIPVYTFWHKLARFVQFWAETAKHPKRLILTQEQADRISGLFMSGSNPEAIGRAFFAIWKRSEFKFFQTFDAETNVFVFKTSDLEMEGLELLWAAMFLAKALVKKRDGVYYQLDHPMVKRLAGIAVQAPLPQKKEI
jgi:hypothetical protein